MKERSSRRTKPCLGEGVSREAQLELRCKERAGDNERSGWTRILAEG